MKMFFIVVGLEVTAAVTLTVLQLCHLTSGVAAVPNIL